ncbi:MFS transporter [Trichococcus ilyis]|uniref:Mfs/sugar transport protein n=1 Tax=Trichococcus ilyis TaxID=640938 RepID=A0A143YQR7_9LACT|nr:MFS transporter [Trichococcus ilyis]CZQ96517.1 mfs/sugar transport protein [Trichococcus ilyis]SEJ51932.1 Na+/melibiose symporter [Trichococcus ilyis]
MAEKVELVEEMAEATKPKKERLPVGKFLAWKSRDISLAASFTVVGYLTFFATNTLGMNAGLVGSLLFASKLVDVVVDLFLGYLVDKSPITRFGKARPYELAIIGVWLGTLFMFSAPASLGMVAKSIWIFTSYTLVHTVFTSLLNSNQTPYIIRAFGTRQMVGKVSSYGGIISTLGAMVVTITFPKLMASMATSPAGWRNLVALYAIPLVIIGLMRFFFVKENLEGLESGNEKPLEIKTIVEMLKKNKFAWVYGFILAPIQMITTLNVGAFYFTEIVGDIGKLGTLQAINILMLLVMFSFPKLMNKISVSGVVALGTIVGMVGYFLNFFAGDNMIMLAIAFLFTGFSLLPVSYLQAVMVMNLASYNESVKLPRMEATANSLGMLFGNIGMGLGSALLGILLSTSGYDGAAAVQPDSALLMIRLLYSFIPMVLLAITFFASRYFSKLDKIVIGLEEK